MRQLFSVALLIIGIDLLAAPTLPHLWQWRSFVGAALLGAFVSVMWNKEDR